jgi:hypothetical protein
MLQQLDIAIALVVVLLGVSLCVTILVQMVSALFNLRGTHLRAGLTTLLATVDPELRTHADAIVDRVLMHPLVSDSAFSAASQFLGRALMSSSLTSAWQRASAIRVDELKGILRALVDDGSNTAQPWYAALKTALTQDPRKLRASAQVTLDDLKKTLPPPEADRLQSIADSVVSQVAGVEGRIDAWFNTTMDRVSQRFTLNVRSWTVAMSIALALLFHFDAIELYNRVSMDSDLRDRLVQLSPAVQRDAQVVVQAASAPDPAELQKATSDLRARLAATHFQLQLPTWEQEKQLLTFQDLQGLIGILIGAGLLSLGSPFWFNALKGLTSLKSTVASSIDKEKAASSASNPAAPAGV